jgi:two-component system phosphate regulon sensor histidine kinase PhoR
MYIRLSIAAITKRLAIVVVITGGIGYALGNTLLGIVFGLLTLLVWHHHHLFKLVQWLWRSKSLTPPQAGGIWGSIYDGLYIQTLKYRKKQKRLNDKIRQFRDGAEALPDAALVLSEDLCIAWGNKKAQRMLGIRWPDDEGQRLDNLLRFPEFTQYLAENSFEQPCLIPSPLNVNNTLELRLMPYGNEQLLFIARDVSKIQRLEQMRRDFVANVSHELKTPLTVVRGYVEMVQQTEYNLEHRWQKAFNSIESQVSRMDRLVEQLLLLSKVESQEGIDNYEQIDMPTMLHSLVDDCQWLNQQKQHEISFDIDDSLTIKGIESEVKSACSNILSNAIAYTPAQGKIHLTWQSDNGKAKFSVKDNGLGIKPEFVNRLTERFFRVDKSRSRNTGGAGLGLAIVKHVLHRHQAELVINSQLGRGCEFSIYFETTIS